MQAPLQKEGHRSSGTLKAALLLCALLYLLAEVLPLLLRHTLHLLFHFLFSPPQHLMETVKECMQFLHCFLAVVVHRVLFGCTLIHCFLILHTALSHSVLKRLHHVCNMTQYCLVYHFQTMSSMHPLSCGTLLAENTAAVLTVQLQLLPTVEEAGLSTLLPHLPHHLHWHGPHDMPLRQLAHHPMTLKALGTEVLFAVHALHHCCRRVRQGAELVCACNRNRHKGCFLPAININWNRNTTNCRREAVTLRYWFWLCWMGHCRCLLALRALEATIFLLHSLQALLAHAVQTAQEVGVSQLTSALHTEEGRLNGGSPASFIRTREL